MSDFLQTLMDALAVGSLYALIALGYTMVYGILKFINFAHSDIFVLGAWVSFSAAMAAGFGTGVPAEIHLWVWVVVFSLAGLAIAGQGYKHLVAPRLDPGILRRLPDPGTGDILALMSVWAGIVIGMVYLARWMHGVESLRIASGGAILLAAMLTCGLVGFTLERLAYKPLRKAPRLNVLITAIGVSLLLQNLGQLNWMFGTRPQGMPTLIPDAVLGRIGGSFDEAGKAITQPVVIRLVDVLGAGTAVVLMFLLDRLVFRTKIGRAMRAVSYNTTNAALMGIPVDWIISLTFVIGAMLAAAAGFLYSQKYAGLGQTASATWVLLGLKAFVAAVVGGIGNIRGAMLGGLLIGLLEFFGAHYLNANLKDVYVFGLLILVLLVRPSGLLGSTVREKV